ncbi:MAG: DNA replication and repair protein RecF [Verrucomicrobiota bacterium]
MIRSLRVVDFRCFEALALEVPEGGGVFTGDNAQGKTSILEAVCLLVRLHSPRARRMATVARVNGTGGFGIAGEAWAMERRIRWEKRKAMDFAVDGEGRVSQGGYLADGGLLVWMGNEDLELVRGAGEVRRRYLDFIGSQIEPGYRRALTRYRRSVKAKNLLLKDPQPRDAEIESYEAIMIEAAKLLTETRSRLVDQLIPAAMAFQSEIAGKSERVDLEYRPAGGGDLASALEQARDRERRQRQSLVGPHRDELVFALNGLPAGEFASEGQQRTLALSLKLAQGQVLAECRGDQPVWLIDDVFGELDVGRRNALLKCLPNDAQKWITTTHLDWLDEARGVDRMQRFRVAEATCREG